MHRIFPQFLSFSIFSLALIFSILFSGQSWCNIPAPPNEPLTSNPIIHNQYTKEDRLHPKINVTIYKKQKAFNGYNLFILFGELDFQIEDFNQIDIDPNLLLRKIDPDSPALTRKNAVSKLNLLLKEAGVRQNIVNCLITSKLSWPQTIKKDRKLKIANNKASPMQHELRAMLEVLYPRETPKKYFLVNLIDMNGNIVHRWKSKYSLTVASWVYPVPFPDGSMCITCERSPLHWQLISINSKNLLTYNHIFPKQLAHHNTCWLDNETFLNITNSFNKTTFNVSDVFLNHVSKNGDILKTISFKSLLSRARHKKQAFPKNCPGIVYIDALKWDIPGIAKKGSWLITVKDLNEIMIIDPKQEKIIWQWGQHVLSQPHHATFLNESHILLFDNGVRKKSSRVIVLEITSQEIVWQYGQKPNQEFYTSLGGAAQRLPNGNTLISETNHGRIFEISPSGEIVWEYKAEGHIREMLRLPYDFFKNVKFNYGRI